MIKEQIAKWLIILSIISPSLVQTFTEKKPKPTKLLSQKTQFILNTIKTNYPDVDISNFNRELATTRVQKQFIFSTDELYPEIDYGQFTGSAGRLFLIFELHIDTYQLVHKGQYLQFIGFNRTKKRPDITFLCHGSYFNKPGNQYQNCNLIYNDKLKKYEIQKLVRK